MSRLKVTSILKHGVFLETNTLNAKIMMLDCVMRQGHTKKVYEVLIELYPASGM